jgi:hypothetical protein
VVNFQTPSDLARQKYPVLIELEARLAPEPVGRSVDEKNPGTIKLNQK